MHGVYRDGLSHLRRKAVALAAEALKRGAGLDTKLRRELPRKLRRELKELERQLGEGVGELDDVAALERRTEEYRQALDVAETMVASLPQYLSERRWRRAGGALLVAMAVGPAAVSLGMEVADRFGDCRGGWEGPTPNYAALFTGEGSDCIYTEAQQCAQRCLESGHCEVRDGDCVATTRAHCELTESCVQFGYCSPHEGRCKARSDEDCASSRECGHEGCCHIEMVSGSRSATEAYLLAGISDGHPQQDVPHYGVCVASSDDDCARSVQCALEGRCAARLGRCVVSHCAYLEACGLEGQCAGVKGQCEVGSDEDCRFSEACMSDGRCMAQGGRCVALSRWGCLVSEGCREFGRCVAVAGRCVEASEL